MPHERLPRRSSHHAPARTIKLPPEFALQQFSQPLTAQQKTGGCRIIRYGSHRQKSGARRSPDTCTSLPEFCGLLSLVSLNAKYAAAQRARNTAFRCCGLRHQTQNGYRADTREPHHNPGLRRGRAAGRCPRRIQRRYRRNPRRSWGQHPNREHARR